MQNTTTAPAEPTTKQTNQWPHGPCHIFNESGTYMVTSSTFHKQHFFKSPEELDMFQKVFFELAEKYACKLEAWAIFSNHYHFIAQSPADAASLKKFIQHLHSASARILNQMHAQPGRKIWHQFWDTRLTFEKSYFARLNYVMQNPVKHGLVKRAEDYPWCSVRWFARHAPLSKQATVASFKIDRLEIVDDY